MKKISAVQGSFVLALALVCAILPFGKVLAADNASYAFSGDAKAIVSNSANSYVGDWSESLQIVTLDNPSMTSSSNTSFDDLWGMSISGSNLFVAGGRTGEWHVYTATSSPVWVYSSTYQDGVTYEQILVDGSNIYLGRLSALGKTELELANYSGPVPTIAAPSVVVPPPPLPIIIPLESTATTINALAKSGGYVYAAQDAETGGAVSVVDLSDNSVRSYSTPEVATSVAANGPDFYVGHGNKIDVVRASDLATLSTIDVGAKVNGLAIDASYLYVASEKGLKIYNLSVDHSLIGERDTEMSGTAVAIDGAGYIYLATSDGINSEIFKIKMVVITLKGENPQTVEYGHGSASYSDFDPGATADDGSTVVTNADNYADAIGTYTIIYTSYDGSSVPTMVQSLGNPGLSVTRTVNVVDTTAPVITLNGDNPMKIKHGLTAVFSDIDPGATTDDGSPVTTNYSDFADKNGTYYITYDAVDASGNHATQVVREVVVGSIISGGGSGGSTGGNNGGTSGNGNGGAGQTQGQVLGAEKFIFTMFLKMGHPPYPKGAYANEVMELQKFLNKAPYNSGLVVDGKFGPLTNAAVIKFQLANGLVGDGLVGPLTRAVLNK